MKKPERDPRTKRAIRLDELEDKRFHLNETDPHALMIRAIQDDLMRRQRPFFERALKKTGAKSYKIHEDGSDIIVRASLMSDAVEKYFGVDAPFPKDWWGKTFNL
jgi:hypothetical protein